MSNSSQDSLIPLPLAGNSLPSLTVILCTGGVSLLLLLASLALFARGRENGLKSERKTSMGVSLMFVVEGDSLYMIEGEDTSESDVEEATSVVGCESISQSGEIFAIIEVHLAETRYLGEKVKGERICCKRDVSTI